MRRVHCLFFVSAAVTALAASSVLAQSPEGTTFQATELSTLTLGSTSGTQGAVVELQDTGLVIDNVAGSTYVHQNGDGTQTVDTGFAALLAAAYDGSLATQASLANGTAQGLVSVNAVNGNPLASYFGIAYANADSLGSQTSFGGIPLIYASTGNEAVIRDDYLGDANMAGVVTIDDYNLWAEGFTGVLQPAWNSGDFNHWNAVTIDDYNLWAESYTADLPPLGDSRDTEPVVGAGSVAAVPEPGTFALCLAAALSGLAFAVRHFRKSNPKFNFAPARK